MLYRVLESAAQSALLEAPRNSDGSGRAAGCDEKCVPGLKGRGNVILNVALGSNIFGRSSHPARARKRGGVRQVAHALEAAIAREFTKVRLLGGTGSLSAIGLSTNREGFNRSNLLATPPLAVAAAVDADAGGDHGLVATARLEHWLGRQRPLSASRRARPCACLSCSCASRREVCAGPAAACSSRPT